MNTSYCLVLLSGVPLLLATALATGDQDLTPIECRGHESIVVSVAVSPGGTLVASGSEDHTLRFWKADNVPARRPFPAKKTERVAGAAG